MKKLRNVHKLAMLAQLKKVAIFLVQSDTVHFHFLSVSKVLEDVSPLLESPNALESYFIQLGHTHSDQGVKVQYLDVIGILFNEGLLPLVIEEGIDYREEDLKQTWLKFFRISIHFMKSGYENHESSAANNQNIDIHSSQNSGEMMTSHLYAKNSNRRISSPNECTATAKAQIYKKSRATADPDAIEVVASSDGQRHNSSLELSQGQKRYIHFRVFVI